MVVVSIISGDQEKLTNCDKYQGPIEPLQLPMGCFCISTSDMEERCWTKAVNSGIRRILAKLIQGGREVVQIVDLPMDKTLEVISTCCSTKSTVDTTWINAVHWQHARNLNNPLEHYLVFLEELSTCQPVDAANLA